MARCMDHGSMHGPWLNAWTRSAL